MSKRKVEFFIVDILIAHNKTQRYVSKFSNAQDFLHSELEWDATIRQLEIIGEATKHLINTDLLNDKQRIVVDFRNYINHEYFGIDENIVWDVITNLINEFIDDLLKAVKTTNIDISDAIVHAIIDNQLNKEVTIFLKDLNKNL